ncbi:MAG: ABA4-like family protein [Spirochaetota bacterium]
METSEILFKIANIMSLISWFVLLAFPQKRYTSLFTISIMGSLVFAGMYMASLAISFSYPQAGGGFGSLQELGILFDKPYALLAGWIHYLAFDLFIGTWEGYHADKEGIPRWLVIPCQIFTFLLGPTGLFLYLLVRWVRKRKIFLEQPFG